MLFSSIPPSPALRGLVRDHLVAHFVVDGHTPRPVKPLAPRPENGITFFLRGCPTVVDPVTGSARTAPRAAVFGQQQARCDLHLPADFLMLRVHLQPGILFRALRTPLHELDDPFVDAEAALGPGVRELTDALAAAGGYAEMLRLVEDYLFRRLAGAGEAADRIDRAAACLGTDPFPSVDRLAARCFLSPRQLQRKFTERLGVGPKLYTRLVRYHHARLLKSAHPEVGWSSVALRCGYSDYQHMVRDFRQFTGDSPPLWLRTDAVSPEYQMPGGP